jgi:hypothetical protein
VSLQGDLNRLLGTAGLGSQRAANELAGTNSKELLGALNTIAGTWGKGIIHVMALIAQQQGSGDDFGISQEGYVEGLDPQGAIASIPDGAIIVGGLNTLIIAFNSAYTGKYMPFRDAAGTFY